MVADEFVQTLRNERDDVAAQLQTVLGQLEPLVRRRRQLEERTRALETAMATYAQDDSSGGAGRNERPSAATGHFLDVALDALQAGGPLHYEALLTRVTQLGAAVPGRNPGANLVAHISRDKRFKRVSRGTYAAA